MPTVMPGKKNAAGPMSLTRTCLKIKRLVQDKAYRPEFQSRPWRDIRQYSDELNGAATQRLDQKIILR